MRRPAVRSLLVVLVIVTYVVQSRQSAKRTPAANKQMGVLMKIMPPWKEKNGNGKGDGKEPAGESPLEGLPAPEA